MKTRKTFLLVVALIALGAVAAVYAYMYHEAIVSVAESQAARGEVASEIANRAAEQEFMKAYASSETDWKRLPKFFVPAENAVEFIEALEALGPQSGATSTISSIDAGDIKNAKPGSLGQIKTHVTGNGSWSSVMRMLELAEILPYKISIDKVNLSRVQGQDWSVSFDVQAMMIVPSK